MRTPFHVLSHALAIPCLSSAASPLPFPTAFSKPIRPPHTHGTRQSRTSRRARRPPRPLNRRLDAEPRTSHALHARTALRTPAQAPFPPEATENIRGSSTVGRPTRIPPRARRRSDSLRSSNGPAEPGPYAIPRPVFRLPLLILESDTVSHIDLYAVASPSCVAEN